MSNLISNLKSLRVRNDLTQAAAAKKAGVSESTWQKIELGITSPTVSTLDKMATALDTTASSLIK